MNLNAKHTSLQYSSILTTHEQLKNNKDSVLLSELTARKEDLLDKIREKFVIGSKLKILNGLKVLLEDIVILMVWCSCIYK